MFEMNVIISVRDGGLAKAAHSIVESHDQCLLPRHPTCQPPGQSLDLVCVCVRVCVVRVPVCARVCMHVCV
jgi:hypothetical protein